MSLRPLVIHLSEMFSATLLKKEREDKERAAARKKSAEGADLTRKASDKYRRRDMKTAAAQIRTTN
jgi:hypothetical protein